MAKVKYQGILFVVTADLARNMPIRSFSAGDGKSATVVEFDTTNEAAIFSALKGAVAGKSIAVFKPPSSKDDADAILIGLAQARSPFGFSLDIRAQYTNTSIQFVHLFQEDATLSKVPARVGSGKNLSLKLEVSLPKADFRHARKAGGAWVDEDDWK